MSFSNALEIYQLSFNCGRLPVNPEYFAPTLLSALPNTTALPDILALSLQEVAPIAHSFLGGSLVHPYFDAVAHSVSAAAIQRLDQRRDGIDEGDPGLVHVLTRHVGLTALMIFARPKLHERIQRVRTAGVGCGLWDMGNKGAVASRLTIATGYEEGNDFDITFVSAHLAPHEKNLDRRNRDFESIVRNLVFTEDEKATKRSSVKFSGIDSEPLLSESSQPSRPQALYDTTGIILFAGDLNYRTAVTRPTLEDPKTFPQPSHPEDSTLHYSAYLSRDQLAQELAARRVLHGFTESEITFVPTYKYAHDRSLTTNIETSEPGDPAGIWNWAPHRWPSWCDRILYMPPSDAIKVHKYDSLPLQVTSDHRPVVLSLSADTQQIRTNEESPYPLNPSYAEARASARRLEVLVGVAAYLGLTTEGNTILAGLLAGAVASWYLVHAFI